MLAFIAQGLVNTFKISPYVDISPNSPCTVLNITLIGCKTTIFFSTKPPTFAGHEYFSENLRNYFLKAASARGASGSLAQQPLLQYGPELCWILRYKVLKDTISCFKRVGSL